MKKFSTFLVAVLFFTTTQAQSVGIGTVSPDPSAMLHINSISKGLLIPKMNFEQRDDIPNPAKGLLVFINVDSSFYYFDGATWLKLLTGNGKTAWELAGNNNTADKFIGTLDTNAFRIYTNNAEKMRIDTAGNIGMNVISPLIQMDAKAGSIIGTSATSVNQHDTTNRGVKVSFGTVTSTNTNEFTGMRVLVDTGKAGCGNRSDIRFDTWQCNTAASREVMRISGNGFVGINNAYPTTGIHMVDNGSSGSDITVEYNDNINSYPVLFFNKSKGTFKAKSGLDSVNLMGAVIYQGYNTTGYLYSAGMYSYTESDYKVAGNTKAGLDFFTRDGTSYTTRMHIRANGNIGLGGVTRPNGQLQFNNALINRKIVLWDALNTDHRYLGFGVNAGMLRYQVGNTNDNHVFFAGATDSTSNELMRITGGGNVGIGTAAPVSRLHVLSTNFPNTILEGTSTAGTWLSLGNTTTGGKWFNMISTGSGNGEGAGKMLFGRSPVATGINGYIMTFDSLLHVGIQTANPHATLQLGNAIENRRIVLWEDANNNHQFYGLGINNAMLRYQTSTAGADHAFFSGKDSTSSNELMRIKGNGNVGIGTSGPGGKFEVNMDSSKFILTNWAPAYNTALMANFIAKGSSLGPQARFTTETGPTFYDIGMNGTQGFAIEENDNPRLTVLQGGNIGIGTATPGYKLDVAAATIAINGNSTGGTNADHAIQGVGTGGIGWVGNNFSGIWAKGTAAGAYGVYAEAGAGGLAVACVGNGQYTGTWTLASDAKFKKDYVGITNAVDKIKQLNPTTYLLKTDEYSLLHFPTERQFGFVAQEIEKVFPTLVEQGKHPGNSEVAPFEYKSVNYIGMIPVLTKAIQEQQTQLEKQQAQIEKQQAQIAELLKRFETTSK